MMVYPAYRSVREIVLTNDGQARSLAFPLHPLPPVAVGSAAPIYPLLYQYFLSMGYLMRGDVLFLSVSVACHMVFLVFLPRQIC